MIQLMFFYNFWFGNNLLFGTHRSLPFS
jgi:hypothetical protein